MPDAASAGVASRAALDAQARQLETLDRLAQRFGRSMADALAAGTNRGRDLSGLLDRISTSLAGALGRLASSALSEAATSTLTSAARSLSEAAILSSFGGGATPFASGGLVPVSSGFALPALAGIQPFAGGGLVSAPTYFPLGRGLGLAGEAGTEAIMPLARGPDGRLGVRSAAGSEPPAVTINIATPDVESFRRSEAQVAASLARAVARGRRAL